MNGEQGTEVPFLATGRHVGSLRTVFAGSVAGLLFAFVILFSLLVDYPSQLDQATDAAVRQYYMWYIHVAVMIFVGFGFLMTFLRSYSYSAVGLNFLASGVMVLFAIICVGIAQKKSWSSSLKITLDLPLLIDSNFCAAAGMISFGALLGKVTPTQLLWLLVLEVPLYAANAKLAAYFRVLDVGGSITIHAFGAYFGLASSLVLSKKGSGSEHHRNGAIVTSDMTAMIGTIFLWIFWPSFNGALASSPGHPASHAQFFCVINTVLSLLGACCAAYATSAAVQGKLDMVHIQNATLAGGVAVGSAANLHLHPAGALAIGIVSGCLSVFGYFTLQPLLERKIKLRDTCGVHNLHGMPGILGGIVAGVVFGCHSVVMSIAAIASLTKSNEAIILRHSGGSQCVHQILALLVTLAVAMAGGTFAAFLVKLVRNPKLKELDVDSMYDDSDWKLNHRLTTISQEPGNILEARISVLS